MWEMPCALSLLSVMLLLVVCVLLWSVYRRWLHAGDRPHATAKKLWGWCPQVAPQEFCYVNFFEAVEWVDLGMSALYTAKMYSKNYECVIMQVTKGALISAWKYTKSIWRSDSTLTRWGAYSAPIALLARFKDGWRQGKV